MDPYISSFFTNYVEPEVELKGLLQAYYEMFVRELVPLDPNSSTNNDTVFKTPLGSFHLGTYTYYSEFSSKNVRQVNVYSIPSGLSDFLKENRESIIIKSGLINIASFISTNSDLFHQPPKLAVRTQLLINNITSTLFQLPYCYAPNKLSSVKAKILNGYIDNHAATIDAVNVKFALGIYPHPEVPF